MRLKLWHLSVYHILRHFNLWYISNDIYEGSSKLRTKFSTISLVGPITLKEGWIVNCGKKQGPWFKSLEFVVYDHGMFCVIANCGFTGSCHILSCYFYFKLCLTGDNMFCVIANCGFTGSCHVLSCYFYFKPCLTDDDMVWVSVVYVISMKMP